LIYNARSTINSTRNLDVLSLRYAKACLDEHEELYNRDPRPTAYLATAYNDLGIACAKNGEYDEATELLGKSKQTREALQEFMEFDNWSPVYHLGAIACAQGDHNDAADLLLGASRIREERLGKDDTQSHWSVCYNHVSIHSILKFESKGQEQSSTP